MALRPGKLARQAVSVVVLGGLGFGALVVGHRRAQMDAERRATDALLAPATGQGTPESATAAEAEPGTPAAPEPGWDIANLDHARVDYWIGRFQTDKRDDFETYLKRMGRYAQL